MRRLESRLLQAPSISMQFHITSLGVREANLTGRLSLAFDGHISIEVEGMIGGTEVKARLRADSSSLLISNNGDLTETATPIMIHGRLCFKRQARSNAAGRFEQVRAGARGSRKGRRRNLGRDTR